MEDLEEASGNTPAFVILLLVLSGLGILWAVSCSWLSGRKKRQRVANNPDVDGLVLQIANLMSSCRVKAPDRYSVSEQIVILPIDDHGQNLQVPTIVVTPPSPQDLVADLASLRSDSSIGSADDLLRNDVSGVDDGGLFDEFDNDYTGIGIGLARRSHIRDSMRNTLDDFGSGVSRSGQTPVEEIPSGDLTHVKKQSSFKRSVRKVSLTNGASSVKDIDVAGASSAAENCSVISINGANVDDGDEDDDDFFNLEQCSPRPRLYSIEPGTKKPNIQISQGR